jgi:hypothetical protein
VAGSCEYGDEISGSGATEFYICMHTYMHTYSYIHTHIVKKTMVSLKAGCVDLLFSPEAGGSMSLRNV